jgi:hypothetical protein
MSDAGTEQLQKIRAGSRSRDNESECPACGETLRYTLPDHLENGCPAV